MSWFFLIIAGCFEFLGVIGITLVNKASTVKSYLMMIGGFSLSFLFLSLAMKDISMGTAYAVWTGIGTVGSTMIGMFFYGEPKDKLRILCITVILASVIGLKLLE